MEWMIYTLATISILGFVNVYVRKRRNKEYIEISNILFNQTSKAK